MSRPPQVYMYAYAYDVRNKITGETNWLRLRNFLLFILGSDPPAYIFTNRTLVGIQYNYIDITRCNISGLQLFPIDFSYQPTYLYEFRL